MSENVSSAVGADLLNDFFAEADEHLARIGELLVGFESSVGKERPDARTVEDLFQQFHSFKGIAGFVGLAPAEAVAHATEDLLRMMRAGQSGLTSRGLEVLTASARKLEQVVAAFRSHQPSPETESLLADLKQLCAQDSPAKEAAAPLRNATVEPSILTQLEEAKARNLLIWQFRFAPTRELDATGVNINLIREELGHIGEIIKAAPHVQEKGKIVFEFIVATREAPADLGAWEAKGVTIHPFDAEETTAAPAPRRGPSDAESAHNPFLAPSHFVRVDLQRLDELMRITGEMVIQRSRLERQLDRLKTTTTRVDLRGVQEAHATIGRSLRDLREAIMRVRLVPVAEIFGRMPFVVRDLARQAGKKVRLKLEGQAVAMDKHLVERLKDPLLHLVRNALSHGVETPAERVAALKPDEATIELTAATAGDSAVITVRDDGKGIDVQGVARKAREMGLPTPAHLDNKAVLEILCASGFSTRDDADLTSGRGIGMAVVAATLRELGGALSLESEEGRGTRFILRLPLTLAITEALIVEGAGQTCAVPQSSVREILQTSESQIQMVNGVEAAPYRSGILPVIRLAELFQLPRAKQGQLYMLVLISERGSVGLLADKIFGQREITVQALRDPLLQVEGVSGATELGDGKPVLILDSEALTQRHARPPESKGKIS